MMRWPSNRKRTAPAWRDLREQNALKICGGRREDDVSGRVRRERVRGFARRTRHAGDGSARAARGERAYLLELGRVPDLEVHLGVVLRKIGTGRAVRGTPRQGGLKRKNRRESDLTAGAVTRDNGLATYLILNLQVDVVSLVVSLLFLFLGHSCFPIRCVACVEVQWRQPRITPSSSCSRVGRPKEKISSRRNFRALPAPRLPGPRHSDSDGAPATRSRHSARRGTRELGRGHGRIPLGRNSSGHSLPTVDARRGGAGNPRNSTGSRGWGRRGEARCPR